MNKPPLMDLSSADRLVVYERTEASTGIRAYMAEKDEAALGRDDLRARVVAHKQVFFAAAWASYETAVPGSFKLIPPEARLDSLAADYRAMQDMFFRPPPTWAEILATLKATEERINAGQGNPKA